jgi:phytoene dehydrogenase-like protein
MRKHTVAVLGAGNGGLTFAGTVALAGHTVNLWEIPEFKAALDPVKDG